MAITLTGSVPSAAQFTAAYKAASAPTVPTASGTTKGGAVTASGDIVGGGGTKIGTASSQDVGGATKAAPVVVTPAAATQDFNNISAQNSAIQTGMQNQSALNNNSQPTFSTGDVQKFLESYQKSQADAAANAKDTSTQGTSAADILKNYLSYQSSGGDATKVPDTVFNGTNTSGQNGQVGGAVDANGNVIRPNQPQAPQTFEDQVNSAVNEGQSAYDTFQEQVNSLRNGTFPLSATEQALVDSTNQSFQRQEQAQELANKNLVGGVTQLQAVTGLDRYAPEIAMGKIAEAVNYGIGKITDIDAQRVEAVSKLQQGFDDKNYKLISESYQAYTDLSKQKLSALEYMHKDIQDTAKDLRDYNLARDKYNLDLQKANADMAATAGITGNAKFDAETIFNGNSGLKITDIPQKQRIAVQAELNTLKEDALKSGDIGGIIKASAGGTKVTEATALSFEKAANVIGQIGDLQTDIDKEATGPIWGTIRTLNPYDTKAQKIKAELQSIVPNLARGIYGEVGVLTDNDINNYSKTLPNLKSTEDVRNAILGITMRSIQRSLENKIKVQAGLGYDVSGLGTFYNEIKDKADSILAPIEALSLKNDLDKVDLNKNNATSSVPTSDFWSNAK